MSNDPLPQPVAATETEPRRRRWRQHGEDSVQAAQVSLGGEACAEASQLQPALNALDIACLLRAGPAAEEAARAQCACGGKDARGVRARHAREALNIIEAGGYDSPESGEWVSIQALVAAAVTTSVHYPDQSWHNSTLPPVPSDLRPVAPIVHCCTVLSAMQALAGGATMGVLNFASARNPGGGFTTGAEAQEESLARSSAIYPCLMKHFESFYKPNRNAQSGVYTHDLIYSPRVPVLRDEAGQLLNQPYLADFATVAAPNLGVMLKNYGREAERLAEHALRERIGRILHTFASNGAVNLVLGAWGCGVFGNRPSTVAALFDQHLQGRFRGRFNSVVFAVFDPEMARIFTDLLAGRTPSHASENCASKCEKGRAKGAAGSKRTGRR